MGLSPEKWKKSRLEELQNCHWSRTVLSNLFDTAGHLVNFSPAGGPQSVFETVKWRNQSKYAKINRTIHNTWEHVTQKMLIVTQKVKKIKAVNERFGIEQNLRCVSFVVDTQ